jgi:hypothetical protein
LQGVKSRGLEGLTEMLARQREIMDAIAREKGDLRPYLDQWERLDSETRGRLRQGRPGEILDALEVVAKGIQARHQEMFGGDDPASGETGGDRAAGNGEAGSAGESAGRPDLSQVINIYRSMQ